MGTGDSESFDVAIIGGGPAGASTALHLVRREGVRPGRVVVLDKARFPRDKPCAGAVSQLGVDVLSAIGVAVDVPQVTMEGVRVLFGDEVGETVARNAMGICVRRTEFDAMLLRAAAADGVSVQDGDGLALLARNARGFHLTTASGRTLDARFLAICDGAGSTTRKLLGLREPARKGHLYVLDTEPVASDAGVRRGLVDFDLSVLGDGLAGYYWDFPTVLDGATQVSRGIYDVRLGHGREGETGRTKDVLARSLARRGIDIARVKLRPFSTRPFVPGARAWVRGAVLVGEAWGIDRTTGEGIAQAIEMGRIAARHLAGALAFGSGGGAADDFAGYEREVCASVTGRHLLQSAYLARWVYGRRGKPALRYLLRSAYGRSVAIDWYRGEAVPLSTQLRLALGLARSALA